MEKSFQMSRKGVAFLMAIDGINRFTPKRLKWINEQGLIKDIDEFVILLIERINERAGDLK